MATEYNFIDSFIMTEIFQNENLSFFDKIIWKTIDDICKSEGCCTLGNKDFGAISGRKSLSVSKTISKLRKMGLIEIEGFDGRLRKLTTDKEKIAGIQEINRKRKKRNKKISLDKAQ